VYIKDDLIPEGRTAGVLSKATFAVKKTASRLEK
jgi:hypothetical protein